MSRVLSNKVVSSLPSTLEPDSIYYVRRGAGFDIHVTNSNGVIVAYTLNAELRLDIGQTAASARSALQLGSAATRDVGSGGGQLRTNSQNDARYIQTGDIFEDASGVLTAESGALSNTISGFLSSMDAAQAREALGVPEPTVAPKTYFGEVATDANGRFVVDWSSVGFTAPPFHVSYTAMNGEGSMPAMWAVRYADTAQGGSGRVLQSRPFAFGVGPNRRSFGAGSMFAGPPRVVGASSGVRVSVAAWGN